jgi:hypothetical protein
MRVRFTKSGVRRYGVIVDRDLASNLQMHPAPGYDDWLPHDMVHFLIERQAGLKNGIFGQLAAGGDAHTFVPTDEQRTRRWARRTERRNATSGGDIGRSEELAYAAHVAWKSRVARHRPTMPSDPTAAAEIDALMPVMEEAARAWHALPLGESLTYDWPWPECSSKRLRG